MYQRVNRGVERQPHAEPALDTIQGQGRPGVAARLLCIADVGNALAHVAELVEEGQG